MIRGENFKINDAQIEIVPTAEDIAERLGFEYVGRVATKPNLTTLTATGKSPEMWYDWLASYEESKPGTFAEVRFRNLDDYSEHDENGLCSLVPLEHPVSYRTYMAPKVAALGIKESLFPDEQNHINPGTYDQQIRASGGIDFAVLGIGPDHACGFNFDGQAAFDSVSRCVSVSELTRATNANLNGTSIDLMPTDALTVGVRTVMNSREIWTIASGAAKSEPIARAVYEDVSPAITATVLRTHDNHRFLIDEAAAQLLDL